MGVDLEEDFGGKPFGLPWRSNALFIVTTVVIGLFSETLLYGLVVPVLPFVLNDRIGLSPDDLQGYSSAHLAVYAVSCVGCCPLAGAVADRSRSRKGPYMFGLALSIAVLVPNFNTSRWVQTD
jgi:MFS family permease